ncbi:MAG: prolipoprotein diacylglyceryl transferase [Rikenellaceae bacterium]
MTTLSIIWDIDPVFIKLGSFEIRYYALTWMAAFFAGLFMFDKMLKKENEPDSIKDTVFMYSFISCVLGARFGHCLFYDFHHYISNPLQMLNFREGGLASHGAAIGMLIGLYMFSRKYKRPYIWTLDRVTTVIPIGGGLIRLGNLMNSEIYGDPTNAPWGFVFVRAGETVAMHPTQIYECLIYFTLCIIMCYLFFKKDAARKRPGLLFGVFLVGTFTTRIFVEIIKNPQVAFENDMTLNMGQILSIPFTIIGIYLIVKSRKSKNQLK